MINKMTAFFSLLFIAFTLCGTGVAAYAEEDPDSRGSVPEEGPVRVITDIDCLPMEIAVYDPESGRISSKTVQGSDYIPVGSGDYIQIVCEPQTGSADLDGGEFYVYFYDQNKNAIWDILDAADELTGERNRVSTETLRRLNGFQFTDVPDGCYIRIARANEYNCHLVIWDGGSYGYPLSALFTAFDMDGQKIRLPEDGSACIQVPASAACVIAKPGYTFIDLLTSSPTRSDRVNYSESRFPAQIVYLRGFYGAGRAKNLRIVSGYDYETGEYSAVMPNTDLSDMVIAVDEKLFQASDPAQTVSASVLQNIKSCLDFTWEAKADVLDCWGEKGYKGVVGTFHEGIVYHGIPYRSSWNTASSVGWHVSKQTFMNAANDPDSIFYNTDSAGGPYYSLVCSSFATLVSGFPYPVTNFGMMKDPRLKITKTDYPVIGGLMTNGYSHCFVPLGASVAEDGSSVLTLVEEIGPATVIQNVFEGISDNWKGIGLSSAYPGNYPYNAAPESVSEIPYDITSFTIKNGSARPYRGDQSVYTSAMKVLINIKDPEATRLYYQKFDADCDHGCIVSASPAGKAQFIAIEPGTKQVSLRSATRSDGTFTGAALENGAIYGVWASKGSLQNKAPANVEFFEWYDLAEEMVTYSVKDGALVTDDVFWYARASAGSEEDYIKETKKTGGITIPYRPPVQTENGTMAHSDYSDYAVRAQIPSLSMVASFFRKGQFGAYVTGKQPAADQAAPPEEILPYSILWQEEND